MDGETPSGANGPGALHNYSKRIALSVVAGQVAAGLCLAAGLTLFVGSRSGYSALVGAVIGILPSYYLALRMFRRTATTSAEKALRSIYLGEGIKVVFTVALFIIAMRLLDVDLMVVAGGYFATVIANWIAALRADLGESPRN
ncbi:MAG: ATP synthase subunit I [Gammaproteobacteria bacterium]